MYIIRPAQLDSMFEAMINDFVGELVHHLRSKHSELIAHLSADEVHNEIHRFVMLARHYGFSIKSVITRFVILRLEKGEEFDSSPKVQRLLLDATAGEKQRITQTEQYFTDTAPRD